MGTFRVNYFRRYLAQVHKAIQGGADVRGYFAWSLMDNFEWSLGYSKRFGICHVDYKTQKRTPTASAKFISEVIKANALDIDEEDLAASDFVMIEKGTGLMSAKDNPDLPKEDPNASEIHTPKRTSDSLAALGFSTSKIVRCP